MAFISSSTSLASPNGNDELRGTKGFVLIPFKQNDDQQPRKHDKEPGSAMNLR